MIRVHNLDLYDAQVTLYTTSELLLCKNHKTLPCERVYIEIDTHTDTLEVYIFRNGTKTKLTYKGNYSYINWLEQDDIDLCSAVE